MTHSAATATAAASATAATAATAAAATAAAATLPSSGAMLGVLGGGQLGRMFVHAGQVQGFRTMVLEPDAASPAGAAADVHCQAAYDSVDALRQLADGCVAVTTEFENVPAASLRSLALLVPVSPPADAVQVCQHRAREKQCFADADVPCAPHAVLQGAGDVHDAAVCAPLLPGLLKTAQMGYDGKGQVAVRSMSDLPAAWAALGGVPCVLEKRLPLLHELSVIVARGRDGQLVHLPVQQNLHREGILAVTQVPAPDIDAATAAAAIAHAQRLAAALSYVGVLCVEFFVLTDGALVANEMAPRPHNSGHYSIDACDVSQFDLQVRTLAGLPLVQPRQHSPAVMLNLLGDLWFAEPVDDALPAPGLHDEPGKPRPPQTPNWPAVLALPGVRLHLYGKVEPRPGRKMGHVTVTAPDTASARRVALQAAEVLGLPAF